LGAFSVRCYYLFSSLQLLLCGLQLVLQQHHFGLKVLPRRLHTQTWHQTHLSLQASQSLGLVQPKRASQAQGLLARLEETILSMFPWDLYLATPVMDPCGQREGDQALIHDNIDDLSK
jgi:hypothetical protein